MIIDLCKWPLVGTVQIVSRANSEYSTVSSVETDPVLHLCIIAFPTFNSAIDDVCNDTVARDATGGRIYTGRFPSAGYDIVGGWFWWLWCHPKP